jgi:ribosomal-protein-alanine N-acetyltransferase
MLGKIELERIFSRFPSFDLGNIILREIEMSDARDILNLLGDPLVAQYQAEEDVPNNESEAINITRYWRDCFYKRYSFYWAIADAQSKKLIGSVGFCSWSNSNRRIEISYELMPEYWRRGIMTRVLNQILQFAFNQLRIFRVEARTVMHNEASQLLLKKFNFMQEGILRGYRIIKGQPADISLFSLVQPESTTGYMLLKK